MAPHKLFYPKILWAEENAEDWWIGAKKVIKLIGEKIDLSSVNGVAVSGQAPTCLPIDREGKPLRNAIIWIDGRAKEEVQLLKEKLGNHKSFKISGNIIDSYFGGPKFFWLRRNEQAIYEKTFKILQSHSYVTYKLTGEIAIDYSTAGLCAPFYDYRKKNWSEEVCNLIDFDLDKLPEIKGASEVVGEIASEAASETGLKKGTPVITGGGDFAASTLAAGVTSEGEGALMLGTGSCLLTPMKEPKYDPRLVNTMHVVKDTYLTNGWIYIGIILRWFREEFCRIEEVILDGSDFTVYQLMDERASKIPIGSDKLIILPYFMGEKTPLWDPLARGTIIGLTPKHTKIHIYRAILESLGYEFYTMMSIMQNKGIELKILTAVNGGAKSSLWRQILADITGKPVAYIKKSEGAALGDCILAGIGSGQFTDEKVVKNWIEVKMINEPNMENHRKYQRLCKIYTKLYECNREIFKMLAET